MTDKRTWSALPMDLVSVITKKLPGLPDFARFRAVCKTWGSTPLSSCPSQLPWLLEWSPGGHFPPILPREQQFYSLSSGETGTIHVEESHWDKEYKGPCGGYLLLLHGQGESRQLSLFNPLTNDEISLPPIHLPISHWPAWTNTNQTGNEEVMFVDRNLFQPEEEGTWPYHHPDNKEWISLLGIFKYFCYWNGMFFSTEPKEDTKVFHVTFKKLLYKIPPPECEIASQGSRVSLITSLGESSAEILRVFWFIDWHKFKVDESVFLIHRLDLHGENPFWVKIDSIGDQMIFLDELNGFSVSAKPSSGIRGNCIYFIHLWFNKPYRYNIEDGTVEIVPCPFEDCNWFVPSLQ